MTLLKHVLPQTCFLCGSTCENLLCSACYEDLPFPQHACAVCACALPEEIDICARCMQQAVHFDSVRTALRYAYPANALMRAAKYRENFTLLHYLGQLMATAFAQQPHPDVLLPVPSHPRTLRARGFNQAVELAKVISHSCRIPLAREVAFCVRHKRQQVDLSAQARKANVRGAFRVGALPENWRHLVLVDDVVTTGATVDELARMCRLAGAQRVDVWCCMRNELA